MNTPAPSSPTLYARWQALSAALVRGFHAYANWLVGLSWKRFAVLSVLLLVGANVLESLPPFTWRITEQVEEKAPRKPQELKPAKPVKPVEPAKPAEASKPAPSGEGIRYEVTIDERGVRIIPREIGKPAAAASAASAPASGAAEDRRLPAIDIRLPDSVKPEEVREAVAEARRTLEEAARDAEQAIRDAEQARLEAIEAMRVHEREAAEEPRMRIRVVRLGDFLIDLAVFIVVASAIIKITYKGRIQAEVKAAQATETAEAESLKRQVVEARMAAMQA
ncbi:MAG: sensor histidine kinase, partial [Roseateles sp.]